MYHGVLTFLPPPPTTSGLYPPFRLLTFTVAHFKSPSQPNEMLALDLLKDESFQFADRCKTKTNKSKTNCAWK